MNFTFVHAADLHLDSPLKGLSRYEGAPVKELREATRSALRNLVELAIEEEVSFVVISGDLYDGDWTDFNTGLFLVQRFKELEEAGIPVFAIKGNHDAESRITRSLRLPSNVTMFGHRKPETVSLEKLRVSLHGQSFAKVKIEENLALNYPDRVEGHFNIGLLHTSADGREGHATYAPCSVNDLTSKGYDYWALGHVHNREILHQEPWVVFPGNIQGRHVREVGDKGASLVRVVDGRVHEVQHRSLDVIRWAHLEVDVTGCEEASDVLNRVDEQLQELTQRSGDRLLAVRLELSGACRAHHDLHHDFETWLNEMRSLAGERVWFEKVKFHTTPLLSPAELAERDDTFALLLNGIEKLESDSEALEELGKNLFGSLEQKLPAELRMKEDGMQPTDPAYLRELLPRVRQLLSVRLSEKKGSAS